MKKKEKLKDIKQPFTDQKLTLNKLSIRKEIIGVINNPSPINDWDTPTFNDNCCMNQLTTYHTIAVCNPNDWCGYKHESDCNTPFLTKYIWDA